LEGEREQEARKGEEESFEEMERELNSMPSRNSAKESSSSFRASDGKQLW